MVRVRCDAFSGRFDSKFDARHTMPDGKPKPKVLELQALKIPGLPRYAALGANCDTSVKHIYFIRHGEATHNVQEKPWGPELIDARLTDVGVKQAKKQADEWAKLPIDVVIVSPLTRALDTAVHGLRAHLECGVPFVAIEECREQIGQNLPDKRRSISDVAMEYPRVVWDAVTDHDDDYLFTPKRESLVDLSKRADLFLSMLIARPEQHIAVVTHSSFLAALFNAALDVAAAPEAASWFANAELREVRLAPISPPSRRLPMVAAVVVAVCGIVWYAYRRR